MSFEKLPVDDLVSHNQIERIENGDNLFSNFEKPLTSWHLKIGYDDYRQAESTNKLLWSLLEPQAEDLLTNIRKISLSDFRGIGDYALIRELFQKATQLQDIYWIYDRFIPEDVIAQLASNRSQYRLHLRFCFSPHGIVLGTHHHVDERQEHHEGAVGYSPDNLKALIDSCILYNLEIKILSPSSRISTAPIDFIHGLLTSCPYLQTLKLSARQRSFDSHKFPDLNFVSLKELNISGYDFLGPLERQALVREQNAPERQYGLRYIKALIETYTEPLFGPRYPPMEHDPLIYKMDWSNMRKLTVSSTGISPEVLRELTPQLKSLKEMHVSVQTGDSRKSLALIEFLEQGPSPLERISFTNVGLLSLDRVIGAFNRYSTTLTHVEIHETGSEARSWSNDLQIRGTTQLYPNTEQIQKLTENAPNIELLAIDISRSSGFPYMDLYTEIAKLSKLRRLVLYLQSQVLRSTNRQCHTEPGHHWAQDDKGIWEIFKEDGALSKKSRYQDPLVNVSSVKASFEHILFHRSKESVPIELEVRLGHYVPYQHEYVNKERRYRFNDNNRCNIGSSPDTELVGLYQCSLAENGTINCQGEETLLGEEYFWSW
jgi:hypothetical protein